MLSKILVPTDGSESSLAAAKYAAYLASKLGARVTIIHVVQRVPFPLTLSGMSEQEREMVQRDMEEAGKAFLRLTQKPLADAGVAAGLDLREGRPADEIIEAAKEGGFDLIVIGNRGRGMVSRVLLGSVTQEVIQAAPCPVLVVREG